METKILIVVLIMILSVGPMEYFFFSQPKQLEDLNNTTNSTTQSLSGDLVGLIIDTQPYINYIGFTSENNQPKAESILAGIPGIGNYSLSVSLNPYGNGYLYNFGIPVNDTSQLKTIGFRIALRASLFFNQQAGPLPVMVAKLSVPTNVALLASNGQYNLTAPVNQTVTAFVLYPKIKNELVRVTCNNIVVSSNNRILQLPVCEDADIAKTTLLQRVNLTDFGLTIADYSDIKEYNQTMPMNVFSTPTVELNGTYSFASMQSVSIPGLESQTNSSILLHPLENDSTTGSFVIKTKWVDTDTLNYVESVFAGSNFTITSERKDAYLAMPANVTLGGQVYEVGLGIPYVTSQIRVSDSLGSHNFLMTFDAIYGEVINIVAKEI